MKQSRYITTLILALITFSLYAQSLASESGITNKYIFTSLTYERQVLKTKIAAGAVVTRNFAYSSTGYGFAGSIHLPFFRNDSTISPTSSVAINTQIISTKNNLPFTQFNQLYIGLFVGYYSDIKIYKSILLTNNLSLGGIVDRRDFTLNGKDNVISYDYSIFFSLGLKVQI